VLEKAGFEVVRFVPEMNRFLYRRYRQDSAFDSNQKSKFVR
jgi:hypothetical protein